MAEWMISSEEHLISSDEENFMSTDEEHLISSDEENFMSTDEENERFDQHYQEALLPSIHVPPVQIIQLITEESLLQAQREDLRKVMDILAVKEQHARTLLIHCRWNFARLQDAIAHRGIEWLFSQAGVALTPASTKSLVTICYKCTEKDLKEGDTATMMDCGHTFCNVCWTQHFLTQISEGQSKRIKCMAPDCNIICDEDIIRKLVTVKDPGAAQRFDRCLFQSYIDDNRKVKWCPSVPHCGNAVRVEGNVYCEIQCTCGHQFCFNCLAQPHSPCSCLIWKLWDKKCRDESETSNWILTNTKSCPNCGKNVHKDGGCNLVSCVCGQHICWLCGCGIDNAYDAHSCGSYKQDREMDLGKAERDLKRYTHYYSRWKVHQDSLKLDAKQWQILWKKIMHLERKESESGVSDYGCMHLERKESESGVSDYGWLIDALRRLLRSSVSDYGWLIDALQRLLRSRRALSYSYPFAFHTFGDDILREKLTETEKAVKQNLFEHHQHQLEATVDRLSKMIDGDEQFLITNREKIIDLSVLTQTWCAKLFEFIENDLLPVFRLPRHFIATYNSMGLHIL